MNDWNLTIALAILRSALECIEDAAHPNLPAPEDGWC